MKGIRFQVVRNENSEDFSYFFYDRNIREVECEMYLFLTFIFKVDSKFEIRNEEEKKISELREPEI